MQLRVGTVAVENGQTEVHGLYVATYTSLVGSPFSPGTAIRWGTTGLGIAVYHDAGAARVAFYRTSGELPTIGTTIITVAGPTTSVLLTSWTSESTPNFATELAGPGGPPLFSAIESGVVYNVIASTSDSFTLAGPYGGVTELSIWYTITRDFTPYFAWPQPAPGDVDLAALLSRLIALIDAQLYGPAKSTPTLGTNWAHVSGSIVRYWKDADRTVRLSGAAVNTIDPAPSEIFTLPVGYRPTYPKRFPVVVDAVTIGVVSVAATGEVTVESGALGTAVYLDTISFRGEI